MPCVFSWLQSYTTSLNIQQMKKKDLQIVCFNTLCLFKHYDGLLE